MQTITRQRLQAPEDTPLILCTAEEPFKFPCGCVVKRHDKVGHYIAKWCDKHKKEIIG